MTRPALALLVSLALTAPALAAQSPRVPVPVGARVRVAAPPRAGWVVGTVAGADSERIVLRSAPRASLDSVPHAGLQALEVSEGRNRVGRAIGGFLLGGIAVGGAAALIGAGSSSGPDEELGVYIVGVSGAVLGAVVGAAVGAITAPERWRRVPVR